MSTPNTSHSATGILERMSVYGITKLAQAGSPPSAVAGYAKGCQYTDLTTGLVYINNGSNTSCLFQQVLIANTTIGGGNATQIGIADAGSFTAQTTVEGALQEVYQNLFSATGGTIDIPLTNFRRVDSNGNVAGTSSANTSIAPGSLLASNSLPILEANGNGALSVRWATGDVNAIAQQIGIPADMDTTAAATIVLTAQGGATNAASFTATTSFNGQTATAQAGTGGANAAIQNVNITIPLANITNPSTTLNVRLTPGTHASDAFVLYGAQLRYKRKLLTA